MTWDLVWILDGTFDDQQKFFWLHDFWRVFASWRDRCSVYCNQEVDKRTVSVMEGQNWSQYEEFLTNIKTYSIIMCPLMLCPVRAIAERFETPQILTRVWSLPSMGSRMYLKVLQTWKCLITTRVLYEWIKKRIVITGASLCQVHDRIVKVYWFKEIP